MQSHILHNDRRIITPPSVRSPALASAPWRSFRHTAKGTGVSRSKRDDESPHVGCLPPSGDGTLAQHLREGNIGLDRDVNAFQTPEALVNAVSQRRESTDALGESTYGNLRVLQKLRTGGVVDVLGLKNMEDIISTPAQHLQDTVQSCIQELGVPAKYPNDKPQRAIFCNRTLNLRSIRVVGFDMDYTLVQYDVAAWEGKAYEYGLKTLADSGIPVDGLKFDPHMVVRGLVVDKIRGNLVKVDRFGLIKRAQHGSRMLSPADIRREYGREAVNLRDDARWHFLNTLFSVSEGCMYMQMVDRMDRGAIPFHLHIHSYEALWSHVSRALFQTHVESKLKHEIINEPEKYVELDPALAATLLDMKEAGKVLLLITNSDWHYTNRMMSISYDRFLPEGMTWRDLFDMVIVQARKPSFWADDNVLYEIVTEDGLMRPAQRAVKSGLYCGGSAKMVERTLGLNGDHFLYVGDHIYTDAALAKLNFKWRTALIVRELEAEVDALQAGRPLRRRLKELLLKKEIVGDLFNHLRLGRVRHRAGRGGQAPEFESDANVKEDLAQLLMVMDRLDQAIIPLIEEDGSHFNQRWGYLSIAGVNDKSQLTRQIEKYADIYTSRVANFHRYTPFAYFRSRGQSLAHDREAAVHDDAAAAAVDAASPADVDGRPRRDAE